MTKRYKTIKGLSNQVNQLTLGMLLSGRIPHKTHGWINFKIDEDVKDEAIEKIVDIIGGHKKTLLINKLQYRTGLSFWSFDRMVFNGKRWTYIAGQDMTWEMNETRKYLYNI